MNNFCRPPLETREDDELQLLALSLADDHDFGAGAAADELGLSRNTVLGWFSRIMAADAAAHGQTIRSDGERERYRLARRCERSAAFA